MRAKQWADLIGDSAWDHVVGDADPEEIADALSRAAEVGMRVPVVNVTVAPDGGKVLWPRQDGGVEPVITAAGLVRYWRARGHRWLALRVDDVLAAAIRGPLLPWFHTVLTAYEETCEAEGVTPSPTIAVGHGDPEERVWLGFVGGAHHMTAHQLAGSLEGDDPPVRAPGAKVASAG